MMPRPRAFAVVLLAMSAIGIGVTAQTPTFRSGVKLIDIDVYVTDKDGQFVKDLTRDDFEVIEDGKPQDLQTLTFVDLPIAAAPAAPVAKGPEPDVVTNSGTPGRLYVIVLDSASTWHAPPTVGGVAYPVFVKRVATQFIDDNLQPGDLAAVVNTQGTFEDGQPFTSSKELLRASVDRYGRGLSGDLPDEITAAEMVQRHLDTYRTLQDVATRLGVITGRRKAILWMGAQLRFEMPLCDRPGGTGPGTGLGTKECQMNLRWGSVLAAHRDAMAAATRNNVAIYAIDPAGLQITMGQRELDRLSGLRLVAEDTGGLAVVNTNNFRDGFTNIVRDNSTYYVLGYTPATDYRDGKYHPVTVRIKRSGRYTVRQRGGYTAPAPDSPAVALTAPPSGASAAARDALRLPVPVRGLNVTIFNAAFKGATREESVLIGGEITGDLLLDGRQQVGLSYQVFTQDNHVQVGEYKTFALNLQPDSRENVTGSGLHFVDRLTLPPGRYEMRYAVDQPGGHVGSVVAPLIVPKFDEPLSLSGIVLASGASATQFMLRDDAGIRERLGANPTSDRTFQSGDLLNTYVEVYSNDAALTADDLTVSGLLATADGKLISREDARLRSVVRSGDGRWAYTVQMDLADIPAGSYVVTLEATSTRHKEPVRRAIPIIVVE
jgi:VWFA-related protein